MAELKKQSWHFLPFIVLSKTYIKFYKGKNNFWVVLPSHVLSFILALNIFVIIRIIYDINVYLIMILYLLLYFLLGFIFDRNFKSFEDVNNLNLTLREKFVGILILVIGIVNFIVLLNIGKIIYN